MNILVNGTSISRGNKSWPYYLQEKINTACNIVNLAQAGSGNTYIHESTVAELSERQYDLVLVQWTYADRFDFRTKNIEQFSDSEYTSFYQSQQNDWPDKIIHPVNDQDYVQKDWVFGCGYINERRDDSVGRVLKEYYQVTGPSEHMSATLIKIISLQDTLKTLNIPYVFIEYRPMTRFDRFENLYKLIDWSQFYTGKDLFTMAKESNALDSTLHPSIECQQGYASNMHNFLIKKGFINGR
jgi:hypothetical protein